MNSKKMSGNAGVVAGLLMFLMAGYGAPAAQAQTQTVMIGGSMDQGLPVHAGDTIRAGYEVSIDDQDKSSSSATISVTNAVFMVTIKCSNSKKNGKDDEREDDKHGKKDDDDKNHGNDHETITINLSARTFSVPGGKRDWSSPENDYQGQVTAPSNLCGGKGGTTDGATFRATSSFSCHASSTEGCCHKVCFRFHGQYDHRGGTFSHKSCKREKVCASPVKHGHGHCCDKDRDRD